MVQSACGAHKTEEIEGDKGKHKSYGPAPKSSPSPFLIEAKTKYFGEPVGKGSKVAKENATNDHGVEMGDEEEAVV